ncbi:glucuronosyltransferase sqv-8-like protein [Leptotrombidium deliense]|uniref:Galactosylgalactosylxylosylprotein 3-beta-glucuronosyltransferase n=1 Tax=Leptotrombidium deliense TaxID=299467 RepID=A0A443S990_9ACAR|nr:glucuronosyltransferase sqv-8-like protein [Leptotrombidium deliense]
MKRLTTKTTATVFLLVPCLVFLVIVKSSDKNGNNEIAVLSASKSSVSEIAQFMSPSNCKCNCNSAISNSVHNNVVPTEQTDDISDVDQVTDIRNSESKPVVYVITPTYTRPTQMADLTRFAQTLMLVKNILWIVVEDSQKINPQIDELLNRTGIASVHLLGPRPVTHRDKRSGRGVSNRIKGLKWIRDNVADVDKEGVIYFADDDNTYDIRIFDEMRDTKKVSVWPVALFASIGVSTPIIDKSGKVIGFHDPFLHRRKFAVDMAGFAFNLQLFISKPKAMMPYKVGYEEDYFIKSLGVTLNDLEPKADNCTKIFVWHTKTQQSIFPNLSKINKHKELQETNVPVLYKHILKGILT